MSTWMIVAVASAFLIWRLLPTKGIQTISTAQLKNIINDRDKVFVDVRTVREYKVNGLKQFINIPLGSSFARLPKEKEIVVICQSGMRSKQACKQLKKLGYEKVTNVRGGMSAY